MDIVTIIGIILALIAVLGGSILKGAGIAALLSTAAFLIVVIGTIASLMIHTPGDVLKHSLKIIKWMIRPPLIEPDKYIEQFVDWAKTARKEGLLGLESVVEEEENEFLRKGLQLLVDGGEPENIRFLLEMDLDTSEAFDTAAAKVWEAAGVYAPTLGIIGAVLGLMAVMQNLADPSKLGKGIAAAFTATVYGIGFANLAFLPIANKLKASIAKQSKLKEMMIEGLIFIAEGENPRNISAKLEGYFVKVEGGKDKDKEKEK
ncbi:MAG: flagellar motor protein [Pseudomonadales bacterium]|nr:flagellar motor protein [Pseudomonadales bacterium]